MAAARETAGGFVPSGTKLFVPNVHLSDALVVAVRTQDGSMMENGVSLFLVTKDAADLTVTSPGSTTRSSTSRLSKASEVAFDDAIWHRERAVRRLTA